LNLKRKHDVSLIANTRIKINSPQLSVEFRLWVVLHR
jgi:hypothetical protein